MTVSGISHYRGGTIDEVAPLAKKLKAIYLKHGVAYRLSRFQTGPNVGDWFVVVQYADQTAYEKVQAAIAQDPECQQTFVEIATFAKRISREIVIDLDQLAEPVRQYVAQVVEIEEPRHYHSPEPIEAVSDDEAITKARQWARGECNRIVKKALLILTGGGIYGSYSEPINPDS
jgi:hypothetical protein